MLMHYLGCHGLPGTFLTAPREAVGYNLFAAAAAVAAASGAGAAHTDEVTIHANARGISKVYYTRSKCDAGQQVRQQDSVPLVIHA